jgi:hypothetical protein
MRNLARGTIEAELRLDPFDLGQRFLTGGAQGNRIATMQHNLEARRHGLAGDDERLGI